MSLHGHVRAVRALAAGSLVWVMVQAGQGLWLGDWRYALSEAAGGLLWLALVVVLPLRTSGVLACPSCGHSYGPRILLKMACPRCGAPVPADVRTRRASSALWRCWPPWPWEYRHTPGPWPCPACRRERCPSFFNGMRSR